MLELEFSNDAKFAEALKVPVQLLRFTGRSLKIKSVPAEKCDAVALLLQELLFG